MGTPLFRKTPTLELVETLANTFRVWVDDRPSILKEMTVGAPTTEEYNRFLYAFVREFGPDLTVETGTDRGRSAGHFAAGHTGRVFTIDIEIACAKQAEALGFMNLTALVGDGAALSKMFDPASIDVLFVDSLHTKEQASAEYAAFREKLAPGAVVFLDDIHIDREMEIFWEGVREPKIDLTPLHYSGFGVIKMP